MCGYLILCRFIQVPGSVKTTTLGNLQDFLRTQYGVFLNTLSWADALLYASFLTYSDKRNVKAHTVEQLLVRALRQDDVSAAAAKAQLRDRLKGQEFILLQVTGTREISADDNSVDEGEGQEEVRIPPLKLFL